LGEICGQYLKKGKLVAIDGRLQFGSYERDGQVVTTADVVADNMQMLDRGTAEDVSMIPEDAGMSGFNG
ncbi:single-stranded DNA-binding protein, partial [bacterium]|nr:single-stranded DNA-binding protein [bacterium]